jgi:hypothetical protein
MQLCYKKVLRRPVIFEPAYPQKMPYLSKKKILKKYFSKEFFSPIMVMTRMT